MTNHAFLFFILLFFGHWLGDFVLQSHYVSINKSKSVKVLSEHVLIYTAILFISMLTAKSCCAMSVSNSQAGIFILFIFGSHFITDFVTSRLTAHLWAKGDVHNFFVMVGLDQLLHAVQIICVVTFLLSL